MCVSIYHSSYTALNMLLTLSFYPCKSNATLLQILIDSIFVMLSRRVFNKQVTFLCVPTVLHFSPTCSFIRMGQTSYQGFCRNPGLRQPDPLISLSSMYQQVMSFHLIRIFPVRLKINDTTDRARSSLYLDLHIEIDSEDQNNTLQRK